MKTALRVCPECGRLTAATTCAFDGANTLKHGVVYRRHLARGTVLFGRFVVGAFIEDDGAMAIHEGRDEKLHRPARIVVIPVPDKATPDDILRLTTMAASLEKLDHPGIARVLASGLTDKGDLALIGAHVAGRSLTEVMAAGPLSLEQTLGMSIQLFGALEVAHQAGLCHHDLAPARVRVAPDGQLVVMDLGLADLLHQPNAQAQKHPSLARGAPYRAPELLEDRAVTRHADIYSAGAIMLEMVTGQPFTDGALRSEVPPGPLARVIARCLAEKPWNRHDTATEVRQKLEAMRYRIELSGVDGKARASSLDLSTAPPPPPLPEAAPQTDSGLLAVRPGAGAVHSPMPKADLTPLSLKTNLLVRTRRPWWRLLGGSMGLLAAGLVVAVMGEPEPSRIGPPAVAMPSAPTILERQRGVVGTPTPALTADLPTAPTAQEVVVVSPASSPGGRAPLSSVTRVTPRPPTVETMATVEAPPAVAVPAPAVAVPAPAVAVPAPAAAVPAPAVAVPAPATARLAPASEPAAPLGRLNQRALLVSDPPGAAVRIAGRLVGRTPKTLRWREGTTSVVEIVLKGYEHAGLDITDAQNGKLLRMQLMEVEPK